MGVFIGSSPFPLAETPTCDQNGKSVLVETLIAGSWGALMRPLRRKPCVLRWPFASCEGMKPCFYTFITTQDGCWALDFAWKMANQILCLCVSVYEIIRNLPFCLVY